MTECDDAARFRRLEALFHELSELSGPEREQRLQSLSGTDAELAADLRAMLVSPADTAQLSGAVDRLVTEIAADSGALTRLGPYRIVRELGRGGMGRVYEAWQQEPVKRRVALKVARSFFANEAERARFLAERQSLALLDHPNIARLFDAGSTEDGLLWFAMELVDGEPITDWARRHRMGLRERIGLMLEVCDAIEHLHQKGLIHRDLKPANVLVTEQDGRPRPRVIDFGIAKQVQGADAADAAGPTRSGDLLGTPGYMSPEQASLGEIDVDVRTDVYAVGLLLHELLLGRHPLNLEGRSPMSFGELCRHIREDTVQVDDRCRDESLGITKLDPDLRLILQKALAKDREQRYSSVAALADDLRRYLANEPVRAAPPTVRYRVGKFVRRHRLLVAATLSVILALMASTFIAARGMMHARQAEQAALQAAEMADRERRTATASTDFLVDIFRAADPTREPGLETTAQDLLVRGEQRIAQLADEPDLKAELLYALGSAYYSLGQTQKAEQLLREALSLRSEGSARDPYKQASVGNKLADLLRERGEYAEAARLYEMGLGILAELGRLDGPDEIVLRNGLALSQLRTGDVDAAEQTFERALALLDHLPPGSEKETEERRAHRIHVLSSLTGLYAARGRHEEAAKVTRSLLEELSRVLPDSHPNIAILHTNLSVLLAMQGQLVEAWREAEVSVAKSRVALGVRHPRTATHLYHLANMQWRLGLLESAEHSLEEALDIYRAEYGERHPELIRPLARLADVHYLRGDYATARAEARQALEIIESADRESATVQSPLPLWLRLAAIGLAERNPAEAARLLDEATASLAAEPAGVELGRVHLARAMLLASTGESQAALDQLEIAAELAQCTESACALDQADSGLTRAEVLAAAGAYQRAVPLLERAIEDAHWTAWLLDREAFAPMRSMPEWPRLAEALAARTEGAPGG